MPEPVIDGRVIREELDRRRDYWTNADGQPLLAFLSDELLRVLSERYNLAVRYEELT